MKGDMNRVPYPMRSSVLAGTWYPSDSATLRHAVQRLLSQARHEGAKASEKTRAIIVPHAGLVYSGPTASHAFESVSTRPGRVILIGPSHRKSFEGISAGLFSLYRSPLGDFPVDVNTVKTLIRCGLVEHHPEAHRHEHCLEMMLPFIGTRWSRMILLPFLVSQASPDAVRDILEAVYTPDDLICISSDLSHFLNYDEARRRDAQTLYAIQQGQWKSLKTTDACGSIPIAGLIQFARQHNFTSTLLDYRNSGDPAGDRDRVVGYGALAYQPSDSG